MSTEVPMPAQPSAPPVKKGASGILVDLTSTLDQDTLRGRYSEALKEVEQLRRQLNQAQAAEEARTNKINRMMKANETLQMQLTDLNSVVEDVVSREIVRSPDRGSTTPFTNGGSWTSGTPSSSTAPSPAKSKGSCAGEGGVTEREVALTAQVAELQAQLSATQAKVAEAKGDEESAEEGTFLTGGAQPLTLDAMHSSSRDLRPEASLSERKAEAALAAEAAAENARALAAQASAAQAAADEAAEKARAEAEALEAEEKRKEEEGAAAALAAVAAVGKGKKGSAKNVGKSPPLAKGASGKQKAKR